jgi:hypothetical protein
MKTSFHVISGRHEMLSRRKICGTVELWAENCFYINLPSFPFSHLHHHSTFRFKLLPLQGFKVSSHTSKQDDSTNISPITYQHVFQTNNQRRRGVLQRPRQQRQLQKQPRILQSVTHPAGTPPDVLIDISNGYTHWEDQNEQGEKHTLAILAMVQTTSNVSSFILSNIPRRRCFLLVHQC